MFLNLMMLISLSFGEQIRIAVIDSGLPFMDIESYKPCAGSSKDFTNQGILDVNGHGTNIAYLIKQQLDSDVDHCFIFIKVFHDNKSQGNQYDFGSAIYHAVKQNAHIINISMSGFGLSTFEEIMIKHALKKGKTIVAAAGNDKTELTWAKCLVYPACSDKGVIVVGNGRSKNSPSSMSNYGEVIDYWVDGNKKGPKTLKMSGSSQSAAIFTGSLVNKAYKKLKSR